MSLAVIIKGHLSGKSDQRSSWVFLTILGISIGSSGCGNGMIVPLEISDSNYCTMPSNFKGLQKTSEDDLEVDFHQLRERAEKLVVKNKLQEAIWLYNKDLDSRHKSQELSQQLRSLLKEGIIDQVEKGGGGTTENYILHYAHGIKGIFKPFGTWDMDPEAEVGAYLISDLLHFDLVPTTVMRTVDGRLGSVQYFMQGMAGSSEFGYKATNYRKLMVFDYLIFNRDRTASNFLTWLDEKRVVAIDHGRAFKTRCGVTKEIKGHLTVEKKLSERIKSISRDEVHSTLMELRGDIFDRVWDQIQKLR